MTTETDPIETAALNHPDVQAGMQDAADGRVKRRGRPAGVPNQTTDRGARFAPKLDDQAKALLEKVKLFNEAGLGMTHAEYMEQATAYASEQASKWVVRQFEKEYASIRKNEGQP